MLSVAAIASLGAGAIHATAAGAHSEHRAAALVQWHVHEDLCFAGEPNAWWVTKVIPPDRVCPPGTFRLREITVPMVHVWIVPHECGPFASLEGDGAGRVKAGEARLCDHAHGAP